MISGISNSVGAGSPSKPADAKERRLKEACQQFEAIMTGYLLKSMHETVLRAEKPDSAREVYEGMMDQTMAEACSKQDTHGPAEILYRQLRPLLNTSPHPKKDGSNNKSATDVKAALKS